MHLKSLIGALSAERLTGYRHPGANEPDGQVLRRYLWNIQLCEALYPVLDLLEVTLRNALHAALSQRTGRADWYSVFALEQRESAAIQEAIKRLNDKGKTIVSGAVVAEMNFGFWCSLFDVRYEHGQRLWPWLAGTSLPNAPRPERQRKTLSRRINRLRLLRNRVFHYEPIWHWRDLPDQHAKAVEMLAWINADMANVLASVDRFPSIHGAGEFSAPLLSVETTT